MSRLTDTDTKAGQQMRDLLDALTPGSYHLVGELKRAFEDMDAAHTFPAYRAAIFQFMEAHDALAAYVARVNTAALNTNWGDAAIAISATHEQVAA